MKFGGTSVANAEAMTRTISIVKSKFNSSPIVVVSAMSKVTDSLYKIANAAKSRDERTVSSLIVALLQRHLDVAAELIHDTSILCDVSNRIHDHCGLLQKIALSVCTLGELSDRSFAMIVSHGELLSSTILAGAMAEQGVKTTLLDARRFIITTGNTLKGVPQIDVIKQRASDAISEAFAEGAQVVVTQGFIASATDGEPAILGRGGSDYSASLIGMAVKAEQIEIWTDVDGVRTADPRYVDNTKNLQQISFEEATEMAHFGAKVLHPLTIEPAIRNNIPIFVLNSLNPQHEGTAILSHENICDGVKAVSWKENIALINIYSAQMVNATGFVSKVFDVFRENGISVDLISTSEANISVSFDKSQPLNNVMSQLQEFADAHLYDDKAQISIIGQNIGLDTTITTKSLQALDDCEIYMISQGASSINVSFVINRVKLIDAVRKIHQTLFAV